MGISFYNYREKDWILKGVLGLIEVYAGFLTKIMLLFIAGIPIDLKNK